jgi:hypothetical protein
MSIPYCEQSLIVTYEVQTLPAEMLRMKQIMQMDNTITASRASAATIPRPICTAIPFVSPDFACTELSDAVICLDDAKKCQQSSL